MPTTIVYVKVKAAHLDEFIAACEKNHRASVQEPGNFRFDVLQQQDDPTCFVLYEAYRSVADISAHKDTPHYHAWRETVADWMEEPRKAVVYNGLFPNSN